MKLVSPLGIATLMSGGDPLLEYIDSLNAQGLIAAAWYADDAKRAAYTGAFSGSILRNWYGAQNGANVVLNGDFPTDFTSWATYGTSTTIEVVGGEAHVIADASNEGFLQTNVPIDPGATWKVTFDYRVISGTLQPYLGVALGNVTGSGSAEVYIISGGYSTLYFYTIGGVGEFYVDNVSVTQVGHLDATLTSTTWDATGGLIANGSTSIVTVANHADLANLDDFGVIYFANFASLGEADSGVIFAYNDAFATNDHYWKFINTNRMDALIAAATTDARATTNDNQVDFLGSNVILGGLMDAADVGGAGRKFSISRGLSGEVATLTLATDTAAVDAIVDQANVLEFFNRTAADWTADGTVFVILYLKNAAAQWATIMQTLTTLAGV